MKKEAARDYATNAFRIYAVLGEEGRRKLKENTPVAEDMKAVEKTLENIGEMRNGDCIAEAVKYVYLRSGKYSFKRGEIVKRVLEVKNKIYVSEIQIYRYLRLARDVFCKERGLCTSADIEKFVS